MTQTELFSPAGILGTIEFMPAPKLDVARFEKWPFPGLTAEETAQMLLSQSAEFTSVVAAAIKSYGGGSVVEGQVQAAIPDDWKRLLGRWMHGALSVWQAEQHGIDVKYVTHDGKGHHFEFRAVGFGSTSDVH